jgi:hypothetical protein
MALRYPPSYNPAALRSPSAYSAAAYGAIEDAAISRARSNQTGRTQREMDDSRYPVTQWLAREGFLGPDAKTTAIEIEAWRQGSAQAGVRLAEAKHHLSRLMSGNDPLAAALGRPAPASQDLTAAREAVTAADDVCIQFRISPTAVEVQHAWLALWDSPNSVWTAALDAIEKVKGPEADRARSWLLYHLGAQGGLARTGGNWILAAG